MSRPTVLSSFACVVDEQSERSQGNKHEDSFFEQVACSSYPAVASSRSKSHSPALRLPEGTCTNMNDWQAAVAKADNTTCLTTGRTRSRSISRREHSGMNRSRSRQRQERHRQRSRSLQPQDSHTTEKRQNITMQVKHYDDFVHPQYIGSHYEDKDQKKAGTESKMPGEDQSESSDKGCYHIRCLSHGITWTMLALVLTWAGLALAVLSRQSLNFVKLESPWRISSIYEEVSSLGIIHTGVCYNETVSTIRDPSRVGCFNVPLASNDDIDDPVFKLAAAFSSVSVLLGFFLTLSTTASLCWRTINFRAIGIGYVFLYCFQSLVFLYFDTDLCENHECKVDVGCYYCIVASICWISSCLLCAKMESNRLKSDLVEERKQRKTYAAKEAVRKRSILSQAGETVMTERTSSTVSDERILEVDEEAAMPKEITRRHSTSGLARQHESIITLDPCRRYSTGQTIVSELTPTPTVDTLDNRNRGRLEYQGNVLSQRGRSQSKPKPTRGRSKSRGRAASAVARRTRSKSKPNQKSNNQHYDRTAVREQETKQTTKKAQRNEAVGPKVQSYNYSAACKDITLSPALPVQKQAKGKAAYVTSYFDI